MSNISSWLVIKTVAPSPPPPHSFDILITQSSPGPCFPTSNHSLSCWAGKGALSTCSAVPPGFSPALLSTFCCMRCVPSLGSFRWLFDH